MLLRTILFLFFLIPFLVQSQFVNRNDSTYKAYKYPNGSISSEGFLINGKPNGYWITYYPNQLRKSEGNRINFELSGVWKFYDKKGNLLESIEYEKGQKYGLNKTFVNCFLSTEKEFENGIQVGVEKTYYPDSSNSILKSTKPFKAGRLDGLAYFYAKDGRLIEIISYEKGFLVKREKINQKDEEGKKQGIWKEYYKNGRLKTEKRFKDDSLNGYVKEYNIKGKLEEAALFIDGEIRSEEENQADFEIIYTYYEDGSLESSTTYNLGGKKDGVAQIFDKKGNVIGSKIYKDDYLIAEGIIDRSGIRNGNWKTYYLSGEIRSEGKYKSGNKFGKWVYYYSTAKKEQEGYFDKNGKYTGKWFWYYENGNLLRSEEYLRGIEDGMLIEYKIDSAIITKGEFIDGKREGEWYYSLNDHIERGKYLYGERNGYWEHKYPNGKISFKGVFESGRPHGEHKYYSQNGVLIREEEYSYGVRDGKWRWFDDDGLEYLFIVYKDGVEKKVNGAKFKLSTE